MKLFHGDIEVNKWYEEEQLVLKSYYGENLIYGEEEPEPPTPQIPDYLSFKAVNGNATIGMSGSATPNVSYSFNGTNWTTWNYTNITIPNGSTLYVKGNNQTGFSTSSSSYKKFTMSGTIEGGGNVMSLLYGDDFEGQLTIPNNNCFYSLFSECKSLVTAPQLPATTLAINCYNGMFTNCTSLTQAPTILPATTLASNCYYGMFQGCTNLTQAPELPARTLEIWCYYTMFTRCSRLNYIKAMFITTPSLVYTGSWLTSVASSGTFVKNSAATWNVSGAGGVPNGWTIEYATE